MPVYLFQRSTRYYVRTHVPEDLESLFPTHELRFSLKTHDRPTNGVSEAVLRITALPASSPMMASE